MYTKKILLSIVSTLLVVLSYVFFFHEEILKHTINFLANSLVVPIWSLMILFLFSLFGLYGCFKIFFSLFKTKYNFHSYTEDNFKNIVWKWSWEEKKIVDLWCYCPDCQTSLTSDNDYLLSTTSFSCVECEKILLTLNGDNIRYILKSIEQDIHRIIIKTMDK